MTKTDGALVYTHGRDGNFSTPVVITDGSGPNHKVGLAPSLIIDDTGHLHVSFYDATYGDLYYANNLANSWQVSKVTPDDAHHPVRFSDNGRDNALVFSEKNP